MAGDKVVTDSRRVAKAFKKQHKNVLRAYDAMECSAEFRRRNFEPRDYYDERGKKWRLIEMTKDGFMFLAMGFTGKEAAALKEAFISAFNLMYETIRNGAWPAMKEHIAALTDWERGKQEASGAGKALSQWRRAKHAKEVRVLATFNDLQYKLPLLAA
ncbi:Rha family transcriptional regulator [Chromobacterium haemolyticum]|nr:Rha family transcriptional regulator [Chromobacterium haemolyticum]